MRNRKLGCGNSKLLCTLFVALVSYIRSTVLLPNTNFWFEVLQFERCCRIVNPKVIVFLNLQESNVGLG